MKEIGKIALIISLLIWLSGCSNNEQIDVKVDRFDCELYQILTSSDSIKESRFVEKYADFLDLYMGGVLQVNRLPGEDEMTPLRRFFKDSTLMKMYSDEQHCFADIKDLEAELSVAMNAYHGWFPKDTLPKFRLHVSGLTQSVVTTDRLVSIAGDKYLGGNYPLYKNYFYEYQLPRMATENVTVDAIKAFLQARFTKENFENVLDQMIYEGVLLNAIHQMLPAKNVSLILGYSSSQFEWLTNHEKECWMYMVENEQLYSADPLVVTKYLDEAPFTSYFGSKSPSRIGSYLGYQIVQSYLKKSDEPISSLFKHYDAQKVLSESGYRP